MKVSHVKTLKDNKFNDNESHLEEIMDFTNLPEMYETDGGHQEVLSNSYSFFL